MPAYNPPHPDMPCIKRQFPAMAIACSDRILSVARAAARG
jgi:hypothetical protein